MAGMLALHVVAGQAVEFVIDERSQPFECGLVPVAPGAKQFGYIVHIRLTLLKSRICCIIPPRRVASK